MPREPLRPDRPQHRAGASLSALCLVAALWLLPGCAYLRAVGQDFGDVFHLGLGISTRPGFKASAQVSIFGLVGSHLPDSWYVGSDYGRAFLWRERGYVFPVIKGVVDRWQGSGPAPSKDEDPDGYLIQDLYFIIVVTSESGRADRLSPQMEGVVQALQIEVGVHALFVGVSVGVNPAQFVDFCAGLLGFDLLGDDVMYAASEDDEGEDDE